MSRLLSVKMEDGVFQAAERCARRARISRNAYVNEAVRLMNRLQERKLLGAALAKEARAAYGDTRKILREFEHLQDEGLD